MEKIALISDIHSNIVALKAVLEDIESRRITRIFCLGDIVLKGSSPCETLDLIRSKCEVVIKGNCDNYAVNPNYNNPRVISSIIYELNILGKNKKDFNKNKKVKTPMI